MMQLSLAKTKAKKMILELIPDIDKLFESEPPVLMINDEPIMIVGDIHGDINALKYVLRKREELNYKNILFLGDYVDRGCYGTEVLLKLFQLKLQDPSHVFLLRGNHEDSDMNVYYGFFTEIGHDKDFLGRLERIYRKMPIAAVLFEHTFCVHGGISGTGSIGTITKANSLQYLWNDPSPKPGMTKSSRGYDICGFGEDIVTGFLKTNNLKMIIRSHQAFDRGYKSFFDGALLSLFSCPDYCGEENKATFALLDKKGQVEIVTFGETDILEPEN